MQKYNKQVRNASNSSLEYMYAHGCDVVVHTRHLVQGGKSTNAVEEEGAEK